MGAGVTLVVLGAILAFAVRAEARVLDLQVVGIIFMIAGAVLIAHGRREGEHDKVLTRVEGSTDPQLPTHIVKESVHEDRHH